MARLQLKHKANKLAIKRKLKMQAMSDQAGIILDETSHTDLLTIMKESERDVLTKHPKNSFARLFWEQQAKATSLKSSNSMRWHPLMVRWCLYLRHLSGKGYDMVHGTSSRGLWGITPTSTPPKLALALPQTSNDIVWPDSWEKRPIVSIVIDEMYIREQIVYDI